MSLWIDLPVVLPLFSIFDNLASRDTDSTLGCTMQILSEPCNLFLYKPSRTFHQRHLTCSQLDLIPSCIATLDAIILKGNTERMRQAFCCIISFGRLTMAVYQKSKLSPSQESVVLLSSLLFNTDSPSERCHGHLNTNAILASSILKSRTDFLIIDCDVKRSSFDLAISTSLIHDLREFRSRCPCAHHGLGADSPALNVIWVLEFSEMQFRDSIPRSLQYDAQNSRHQD